MDKNIDSKLKSLIPTLRTKKRFLKIKVESNKIMDFKEISDSLNQEILKYMGIIDFGLGGLWILKDKFVKEDQTLILKVSTKMKDKLIGSISLIEKIGDNNCNIKILKISGTLKGVEKI